MYGVTGAAHQDRAGRATEHDVEDRKTRETWLRDCAGGRARPDEPLPAPSTAVKSAWVEDPGRAVSRDGLKGGVW